MIPAILITQSPPQSLGLAEGFKPTPFQYKLKKKRISVTLGTARNYPYNWILGGRDSCQAESVYSAIEGP